MVGRIYHVGLTVSDLDRSVAFYRDILGLEFQGEIFMEGKETDKMFRRANCKARVAYLNGSKAIETPPVELIQFVNSEIHTHLNAIFFTFPFCLGRSSVFHTRQPLYRIVLSNTMITNFSNGSPS